MLIDELLEAVLRSVCLLAPELPDPTILACFSVSRSWRDTLLKREFQPFAGKLVGRMLAQRRRAQLLVRRSTHRRELRADGVVHLRGELRVTEEPPLICGLHRLVGLERRLGERR